MTKEKPTFENKETAGQQLVRLLRENGVENLEVKNLLDIWTREQEKLVEQSSNYQDEQIRLNLRRARLYSEAGYLGEAFENFESARRQAWNKHRDELYQEIMKEMDGLEDSMEMEK